MRADRNRHAPRVRDATELAARGVAHAVWAGVERAATQVILEVQRTLRDDSGADVRAHVDLLVDGVWQALAGETPTLPDVSAPVSLRRLLGSLRTAYLRQPLLVQDAAMAVQGMRVVRGIEEVQHVLDRNEAQRFIAGRSGPEALELIVEVAHDMRSPLGAVLLLVDTMRKAQSGSITTVQERQLGLVYGAAFGLSSLVSNLIEAAREGEGVKERDPIAFSVSGILQSVREIVQPITEEKGLRMQLVSPELDWREGYPAALSRVLLNLVTNALASTDEGFVELSARQLSLTRLEFSVRDTGPGIAPELRDALFRAFRSGSLGQVRFSSSGLGLSICQKLVHAMQSELKVETPEGGGSRFSFEVDLPLAVRL
ncbi:MAG: HAMP domain-containing histidine kinase [Gemmatimonadota bacterium]|nr:HAMP domain-containing histidine kinase [Gemmatimonadota bacterium]